MPPLLAREMASERGRLGAGHLTRTSCKPNASGADGGVSIITRRSELTQLEAPSDCLEAFLKLSPRLPACERVPAKRFCCNSCRLAATRGVKPSSGHGRPLGSGWQTAGPTGALAAETYAQCWSTVLGWREGVQR